MGLVGWDGSGGVGGVGHELDGCTAGWLAARQSQPTSCLVRRGRLQYDTVGWTMQRPRS